MRNAYTFRLDRRLTNPLALVMWYGGTGSVNCGVVTAVPSGFGGGGFISRGTTSDSSGCKGRSGDSSAGNYG